MKERDSDKILKLKNKNKNSEIQKQIKKKNLTRNQIEIAIFRRARAQRACYLHIALKGK